jgi:hypothetical protein
MAAVVMVVVAAMAAAKVVELIAEMEMAMAVTGIVGMDRG